MGNEAEASAAAEKRAAEKRAHEEALRLADEVASFTPPTGGDATLRMLEDLGITGAPRPGAERSGSAPSSPSPAVQAARIAMERQRIAEELVTDPDLGSVVLEQMCKPVEDVPGSNPEARRLKRRLEREQRKLRVLLEQRDLASEASSNDETDAEELPPVSNAGRDAARFAMARAPGADVMRVAAANVAAMDIEPVEPGLTKAIASGALEVTKFALAHGAAVLPAIAQASFFAKLWDTSLDGRSKEFQEKLTLAINIAGGVGQVGSILYSRLFPYTEEKPNVVADVGRGMMGIGLAFSFITAYYTGTTSAAATQAARLAEFYAVRDFLLICIRKATNVDARNNDGLADALKLGGAYGVMQLLAYLGSGLTGGYGGAALAAQLATWPEAAKNIAKATVFFGSVEMLNAAFGTLASSKSAKIEPGEELDDAEAEARLNEGPSRSWKDAFGKLKVDVGLQMPTGRLIADQYSGAGINNFNFFLMGINLTGVFSDLSEKVSDDPTTQTAVQALAYAILYGAFAIPFAMALMQNPSDRFKYAPGNLLSKQVPRREAENDPEEAESDPERGGARPDQQTRQEAERLRREAERRRAEQGQRRDDIEMGAMQGAQAGAGTATTSSPSAPPPPADPATAGEDRGPSNSPAGRKGKERAV